MKKFLSISILTILGLTVLSGCQLAKKENLSLIHISEPTRP